MSFLIRKITRSKWPRENYESLTSNDISADAVTSCLRTTRNTLSTWEVSSTQEINEAILALVSGFERIDTIDIVIIEKQELLDKGFELINTPGLTPVVDLVETHIDISSLNYASIGGFSEIMIECLKSEKVLRYNKKKLINILEEAIKAGRVEKEKLKDGVLEKLAI